MRAEFARGSKILQLIWGPRRLAGFMVPEAAAAVALIPESPSSWAFYSYTAPSIVRVTFDGTGVTVTNGTATIKGKKRP